MFTADTQMDIRASSTAMFSSPADQLADPIHIDVSERIAFIDVLVIVILEELASIISGEAEGHLGQIVCSEGEELSGLSKFAGIDSAARNFDHRADVIVHLDLGSSDRLISSLADDVSYIIKFFLLADQRNHDFRLQVPCAMLLVDGNGSVDDCSCLHDADFRISDIQTASAVAHHRVEFLESNVSCLNVFDCDAHLVSDFLDCFRSLRQEFMQRRIKQTYSDAAALHRFEDSFEVFRLIRLEEIQCLLALLRSRGYTEHADCFDTLLGVEEHVLCTDKANPFRTELNCSCSIFRSISIRADLHCAALIRPLHELREVSGNRSRNTLDFTAVYETRIAIDGNDVAFLEDFTIDRELLILFINLDVTASGYAACTHAAGNDCSVAGHAAADSDDCLGDVHPGDIFRRSFKTDEDNLLAGSCLLFCFLGGKHDCAAASARSSSEALGNDILCLILEICFIKRRMQQVIELLRLYHEQSFILRDELLVDHVNCDLQSSIGSTLAVAALQHEQLAMFNRELHILQIMIMMLEQLGDSCEFLVSSRHRFLQMIDRLRSADTSNDVFALCVHQELTEQLVLASCRIAGECDTSAAVIAHVPEYHFHDGNCSSPVIRDIVHAAVVDCTLIVPGTEHCHDGTVQLNDRILREIFSQVLLVEFLELLGEFNHIIRIELDILLDALLFLHGINQLFELSLAEAHDDIAEHLDETAVGVISETLVLSLLFNDLNDFIIHAQVQNRIHHARHGCTRTGTDRNKQRVLLVAQLLASRLLEPCSILVDLLLDLRSDGLVVVIILNAGFRRDRESGRNRQTDVAHLSKVRTFAAEELTHLSVAF